MLILLEMIRNDEKFDQDDRPKKEGNKISSIYSY